MFDWIVFAGAIYFCFWLLVTALWFCFQTGDGIRKAMKIGTQVTLFVMGVSAFLLVVVGVAFLLEALYPGGL